MKASLTPETRTIRQRHDAPLPSVTQEVKPTVLENPRTPDTNTATQTVIGADAGTAHPPVHRNTPLGRGMLGTPAELYDSALGAMRRNGANLVAELAPTIAALQTAGALDRADDAGLTLTMRAAAMGQPAVVEALAKAGANLETKNPRTGATILHYAAAAQGAAGVATLDALPRDVVGRLVNEKISSNGHTVAMEAVFQSNEGFVRRLVALGGEGVNVDFTSRQLMGWSPRTFAARDGREWHTIIPPPDAENAAILDRAAQALAGGRPPADVQTELRTALNGAQGQWVAREDEAWLASIADPGERARAESGMALLAAAQNGDLAAVDRLVASGVSLTGTHGRAGATVLTNLFVGALTPEQLAQRQATLTALLARGADPNVAESGLMLVPSGFREAVFGRTAALETMIGSLRADPARLRAFLDVQGPLNGYTKLIDAALRGNPEVISLLVRSGADTARAGYNGMTALDALRVFNASQRDPTRQISEALLTA